MNYTKDIDKGFKRFKREMQKAKNAYVDVGIVEGGIAGYSKALIC